jgi:hypothetical protein
LNLFARTQVITHSNKRKGNGRGLFKILLKNSPGGLVKPRKISVLKGSDHGKLQLQIKERIFSFLE